MWQEYSSNGTPLYNGGRPAGHSSELEARINLYGVACVWLYRFNQDNQIEVLFQRRSALVDRYPGEWDISAAGHINYQEDPAAAAVREAREEIGAIIDPDNLEYIMALNNGKRISNVYLYDYTDRPDEFHFDDQEVSEVKWVPLEQVPDFWQNHAKETLAKDTRQLNNVYQILKNLADGNSEK